MRLWDATSEYGDTRRSFCEGCPKRPCEDCLQPPILLENIPVIRAYVDLQTQWTVGVGGRTGLRYESAIPWLDRFGANLGITDVDAAFKDLMTMELAELQAAAERRQESKDSSGGNED